MGGRLAARTFHGRTYVLLLLRYALLAAMYMLAILTLEGHETIVILGLAQLLHQGLGLLLGQLLSQVGQQLEQLVSDHGIVGIFVVQLEDLNEVVEATLILGVLGGLVDGEGIGLGDELGSLGGATSNGGDGLEGGVQVAGTDEVAGVEGINLAISLEVVYIKCKVDGWKVGALDKALLCVQTHSGAGRGRRACHG